MARSWAICSATACGPPWNSRNRVGRGSSPVSFETRMKLSRVAASANSIRAIGMPHCRAAITVFTAPDRVSNWQVAAEMVSGVPNRRSWTSVITPSVPSAPQ